MTKFLFSIFAFIIVNTSAQELNNRSNMKIEQFKKQYSALKKKNTDLSLARRNTTILKLLGSIKNEKNSTTNRLNNKVLDSLRDMTIFLLMSEIHFKLEQNDSVFYYHNFLQKNSSNEYLLGKSKNLTNKIKRINLDYINELKKELAGLKETNSTNKKLINKNRNLHLLSLLSIIIVAFLIVFFLYSNRAKKHSKMNLKFKKTQEILDFKNMHLENLSHEIRTPITVLTGYFSLLKENVIQPKKVIYYTELCEESCNSMIYSLNNFLEISKPETTNFIPKITTEEVNLSIIEVYKKLSKKASLKSINLYYKSNILNTLKTAYDFDSLTKIIYNLVANAIKYSSNTSIFMNVYLEKEHLNIVIKDEGIGIDKKEQKEIFNKFHQSDKHKISGGFGVGLSLVIQLIEKLDGSIKLESELDIGSIFYIKLPINIESELLYINENSLDYKLINNNEAFIAVSPNLPKILIVDDNIGMISYLKEIFSETYNCSFAHNGKEALEKIRKEAFDIIISDLKMPQMDGVQFKKELNKIVQYKSIPFILITAVPYDIVADLKLTLELNDYIAKPFSKNELTSRVQFLLQKSVFKEKIFSTDDVEKDFDIIHSKLIENINKIVLANLENPSFNVEFLATECGYTQKKLNKILKAKIGLSSLQVISEIRLLKAYEFIIKNKYQTMNEVIYAVGFSSRSHFNKKFKERFGIKPGDLKEKYKI